SALQQLVACSRKKRPWQAPEQNASNTSTGDLHHRQVFRRPTSARPGRPCDAPPRRPTAGRTARCPDTARARCGAPGSGHSREPGGAARTRDTRAAPAPARRAAPASATTPGQLALRREPRPHVVQVLLPARARVLLDPPLLHRVVEEQSEAALLLVPLAKRAPADPVGAAASYAHVRQGIAPVAQGVVLRLERVQALHRVHDLQVEHAPVPPRLDLAYALGNHVVLQPGRLVSAMRPSRSGAMIPRHDPLIPRSIHEAGAKRRPAADIAST